MQKTKFKLSSKLLSATMITLSSFGITLPTISCSQQKVDDLFFTVNTQNLEVTFCDRGASIYSIKYTHGEGDNKKTDFVTYHPQDKQEFISDKYYHGKTLGRVTGRIKDGKLKLPDSDKEYELSINEKTDGSEYNIKNNSIHGGNDRFAVKDFKRFIINEDKVWKVAFNYVSPALESGYPEIVDTWMVYSISKLEPKIDLDIEAISTGPTPINVTNHPYFNLGNSTNVKSHILKLNNANQVAVYDNMQSTDHKGGQVVMGLKQVEGTPWDFTKDNTTIGQNIDEAKQKDPLSGGYDHIWKFDDKNALNLITLANPETHIQLDVTTDADAIIMYANCYPVKDLKINDGKDDALYGAITVEPYDFFVSDAAPDEYKEFKISEGRTIHSVDKPFTRHISYKFSEI